MTNTASKELLRIENLYKQYGDNEVLKGVSLKANSGDVISIIGSSGSGKSTWLRCINFLEQPTSGKIIVAGEEVKLLPGTRDALKVADQKQLQKIRTRLSMVFQHFNLWGHMTVLENVIEAPIHVLGLLEKGGDGTCRALSRTRRRLEIPRHLSGAPVRRPTTAGGDCACPGDGTGGAIV
jgi:histidine transport system ATP-binding protein